MQVLRQSQLAGAAWLLRRLLGAIDISITGELLQAIISSNGMMDCVVTFYMWTIE